MTSPDRRQAVGVAFDAPNNSQHTTKGARKFVPGIDRFDKLQDIKESMRPGPTSYQPGSYHYARRKTHLKNLSERFAEDRYCTDVPGPGEYRV